MFWSAHKPHQTLLNWAESTFIPTITPFLKCVHFERKRNLGKFVGFKNHLVNFLVSEDFCQGNVHKWRLKFSTNWRWNSKKLFASWFFSKTLISRMKKIHVKISSAFCYAKNSKEHPKNVCGWKFSETKLNYFQKWTQRFSDFLSCFSWKKLYKSFLQCFVSEFYGQTVKKRTLTLKNGHWRQNQN